MKRRVLCLFVCVIILFTLIPIANADDTALRIDLAQQILNNDNIVLKTTNSAPKYQGEADGADAKQNIIDTAAGKKAKLSSYADTDEGLNTPAPGGEVYLSVNMLRAMLEMEKGFGKYRVTAIAGGCHSAKSTHYSGISFDATDAGTGATVQKGKEIYNYLVSKGFTLKTVKTAGSYGVWENSSHYHIQVTGYNGSSGNGDTQSAVSPMSVGAGQTIPDGNYIIANVSDTRFYLDIYGGDASAGDCTNVQVAENENPPDVDIWTVSYVGNGGFYKIKQLTGDAYLDVIDPQLGSGQNVQVWPRYEYDDEVWSIAPGDNSFLLQSKANGLYATVDGNLEGGTNVVVRGHNGSDKQNWVFIPYRPSQPVSEGKYVLLSTINSSCELDVAGDTGDIPDGQNVQIWADSAPSRFNSFNLKKLDNGYYLLIHDASGKALTVESGSTSVGQNITVRSQNGSAAQQWAIRDTGGGYALISRCSGHVLDLSSSDTTNGNNIHQWIYNGTNAQKWTFVKAEHIVSYNANGGTGAPGSQTKYYGNTLTLSSTKPTRASSSAGSYKVTLNANGGSVSPTSMDAARTTSYSFKNWNTAVDGSGTSYNPGGNYTANADATLYAQWNSNNATAISLPTPTRDGYTFKGWATSSGATNGVTGSYTPSGDVTLYATWEANTLIVKYHVNGGTISSSTYSVSSSGIVQSNGEDLSDPWKYGEVYQYGMYNASTFGLSRPGYQFVGWSRSSDGSQTVFDQHDESIRGEIIAPELKSGNATATLYAVWEVNSVFLDVNGYLDGVVSGNVDNYGTFDVWINGNLVADDRSDFCQAYPIGTTYKIDDIKTTTGHIYNGLASDSAPLSGTFSTSRINVFLSFASTYDLDLNGVLDGTLYGSLRDYGVADVYINGELKAQGVNDYNQKWPTGTAYEFKNIRPTEGHAYYGLKESSRAGTVGDSNTSIQLDFRTCPVSISETPITKVFNGHTYCYYSTPMTWYDAKTLCEALGGHLATITSAEEDQFVSGMLHGDIDAWLGATDIGHEGEWRWITGESFSYTNWMAGQPDNGSSNPEGSENYLQYRDEGCKWNDNPGCWAHSFICEFESYTVSYAANGGMNAPETQSKVYGVTLTLSEAIPTRGGYYFLGWAESADAAAAVYLPGGNFSKDADTTLYAVWQKAEPDFILPASLTAIESEAFEGGAFAYARLPDGVTQIERRAFADCPNLLDVDIPSSATSIDPQAFAGVSNLTIHGAEGSYAEFYASKYGFAFVAD